MKEWECVQVGHHKDIGRTIEKREADGWKLNTYQAQGSPALVNHYLLFERESEKK